MELLYKIKLNFIVILRLSLVASDTACWKVGLFFSRWLQTTAVLTVTVRISGNFNVVHQYRKNSLPLIVLNECSKSKYLKESYVSETSADTCYFHLDKLSKSLVASPAVAGCHPYSQMSLYHLKCLFIDGQSHKILQHCVAGPTQWLDQ